MKKPSNLAGKASDETVKIRGQTSKKVISSNEIIKIRGQTKKLVVEDKSLLSIIEKTTTTVYKINSKKIFNKKTDTSAAEDNTSKLIESFREKIEEKVPKIFINLNNVELYEKIMQPLHQERLKY